MKRIHAHADFSTQALLAIMQAGRAHRQAQEQEAREDYVLQHGDPTGPYSRYLTLKQVAALGWKLELPSPGALPQLYGEAAISRDHLARLISDHGTRRTGRPVPAHLLLAEAEDSAACIRLGAFPVADHRADFTQVSGSVQMQAFAQLALAHCPLWPALDLMNRGWTLEQISQASSSDLTEAGLILARLFGELYAQEMSAHVLAVLGLPADSELPALPPRKQAYLDELRRFC